MKNLYKLVAAMLTALTIVCIAIPTKSQAADYFLVRQRTVEVGAKVKLNTGISNAVYGSTDKNIATVSKKGTVKGKSVGICYVSVTHDGATDVYCIQVVASDNPVADKTPIAKNACGACVNGVGVIYGETDLKSFVKGCTAKGLEVPDIVYSNWDKTKSVEELTIWLGTGETCMGTVSVRGSSYEDAVIDEIVLSREGEAMRNTGYVLSYNAPTRPVPSY